MILSHGCPIESLPDVSNKSRYGSHENTHQGGMSVKKYTKNHAPKNAEKMTDRIGVCL